jgi:hypothetical protein
VRRTCALIALVVCVPLAARAQRVPEVAWRAPASCPREAFDAELARLLAGSDVPATKAGVQLSQRGSGWSTRVAIADASRTLQLASCAEAQRTAALLIATAIAPERVGAVRAAGVSTGLETRGEPAEASAQPEAGSKQPEPGPNQPEVAAKPPEPGPEQPTPEPPAPSAREDAPPARERVATPRTPALRLDSDLRLRIGGQLAVFTLPGVTGGPSLGVELVRGRFVSWLDARYLVPRRSHDGDSELRADLDLFAVALGTAWMAAVGPLQLGPYAELEGGLLRARGRGERDAGNALAPWLAGALGLRADAHLYRRAAASFYAAASIPFWRPGVQLGDEAAFYRTSAAAFRAGIVLRIAIGVARTQDRGQ